MTEIEQAFNLGVGAATDALRLGARSIPDKHGLGKDALLAVAATIDELKIVDDVGLPDRPKAEAGAS